MTSLLSTVLLLLALVLAPIIGGGLGELASGILQILVIAAVACRLLSRGQGDRAWARVPGLWFLVAFVALTLISVVQSRAIYFSLNQLLFISACLGAYLLSSTLCRDSRIATVTVWALALSALFVSGAGVQYYIIDSGGGAGFWKSLTSSGDHERLFGPFINPNFFAGYLVIALPVTLAVFLTTRRAVLAALPAIGFVFEVVALMMTGAKFGVIAAAAALVVFLLLAIATRSLNRSRLIRLLIMVAVMIPLLIPLSSLVTSRVREAKAGGTQVHSTAFRVYTWKATLHMIEDQPLLGVGPGVYGITYPQHTIAGPTKFAHNSYLQIAAETGVPALIALLLLLFAIAWRSVRSIAQGRDEDASGEPMSESITWTDLMPPGAWRLVNCALFAALVGSSVRSLVDSDWYLIGIALPFWVVAGVLVSKSSAAEHNVLPGKILRPALVVACVVAIALSAPFAMGDYWATQAKEAASANETGQAVELYSRAAAISPLNPEYHRQLGLWLGLGQGEYQMADTEISRSISLARNTSEGGWKARGILAGARGDWPMAISSLKTSSSFNPNSTDTFNYLATAYRSSGDVRGYETTLRRLLTIEKSPYEQIKGTPEIIDTTYASAHAYFGRQQLSKKHYPAAVTEFKAAVDRLELWRASGDMRKLQRLMGMSSEADENSRLDLLRDCYKGLAAAYSAMGKPKQAAESLANAEKVK